jgi:ankyrin repeat protein
LRRFPADKFALFHDGGNLYATTIFVLVSAVQKISRCTRIPEGTLLYRGLGGLIDLPDEFHAADEQGRSGYLDWGMMSTSSDRDVALGYSGLKQRRPRAMVMVIEATSVDRGADISAFSQYHHEKEFLWAPCSFVQRMQAGAGRVEVVDGGLVTFVPVRVNLNLKTETVEALLEKKKSMHMTAFEFCVNELKQWLQDNAKAGNAEARLKRDKGSGWGEIDHTVDGFIEAQVNKVEVVLENHRTRAAADYSDDDVYRSLVAQSLEAASMAQSALQWWLRDESQNIDRIVHQSLLTCQRGFESFLRRRYALAASTEERRAAAVELCKARNLMSRDAGEVDGNGELPLQAIAARGASGEDVGLLVAAGADFRAMVDDEGLPPLYIASLNGHASVVKALLALGADFNQEEIYSGDRTPLHAAVLNGHASVVEAFLTMGADVNQACDGPTLLWIASRNGHSSIVEALLARGADVNQAITYYGTTPLYIASCNGHASIVEALLGRGADVNQAKADDGTTPLWIACQYGHTSIVEALLARGADVNQARTHDGATPLYIASCNGHASIVEALLGRGADVNQAWMEDGTTPLHNACIYGHSSVVETLLARGADVNQARTHDGATPLYIASCNGHASIVEALLGRGADVNQARTEDGTTPLWIACEYGHAVILRVLLVAGCDINACSDDGRSPVDIATANGHTDMVQELLLAVAAQSSPESAAV